MNKEKLIKAIYGNYLKNKQNVVGLGTGLKVVDGELTGERCVLVGVSKKLDSRQLTDKDTIPKTIMGVPTDVLEIGDLEFMWRGKHRPLKMGASCCWDKLTACSAGLPLYDKEGNPYLLMNKHCVVPDDSSAKVGDGVINPGPADGGKITDKIGEVTEIYFPVSSKRKDNIDMALVKLDAPMKHEDVVGTTYIHETRYLKEALIPDGDVLKRIFGGGRTLGKVVHSAPIISVDFEAGVWGVENGQRVVRSFPQCVLVLNESKEGGACVLGGDSSSVRLIDGMPLVQTFAGSETVGVFNQVQASLDWIYNEFGLELFLEPPVIEEGWIALGSWMRFDRTTITIKSPARFRKEPSLDAEIIRVLPYGDKLQMVGEGIIKDNYYWVKCQRE